LDEIYLFSGSNKYFSTQLYCTYRAMPSNMSQKRVYIFSAQPKVIKLTSILHKIPPKFPRLVISAFGDLGPPFEKLDSLPDFSLGVFASWLLFGCVKADFQSSHEAPRSSLRVHAWALSSNHNAELLILIRCKHSQRAARSFMRGLEIRLYTPTSQLVRPCVLEIIIINSKINR
jgi:hypothetical protein